MARRKSAGCVAKILFAFSLLVLPMLIVGCDSAGESVFVSGTASIDASGATTNIGNAQGQIRTTIENVRAVLRDMCCSDQDVVQVAAYCRTTEVEKIFNDLKGAFHWRLRPDAVPAAL